MAGISSTSWTNGVVDLRTLTVQSILYENDRESIVRAAEATANSVHIATTAGLIGEWTLALGECGTEPTLDKQAIGRVRGVVESTGGTLIYEVFGQNLGHGGGHNRLVPLTESELLLFLNPDAVLAPNTIESLVEAMVEAVGVVDGRQLPLEHPKDFNETTGETSWASGACSLTSRRAFEAVSGFDHETFFLYCDDVDYSWRLKLAGFSVLHEPSARVFHDKRLQVTGDIIASSAEVYYSAEAGLLLAHKYSQFDKVAAILASFRSSSEEHLLRAAREFELRRSTGRLPPSLDPGHTVGQFINGNYAVHRY
ncbi:MAG: glycosyltransferase [Kineosporiaceae bacterium]|nr:glycosyltransferase [Aeromicrobium sp.]